MEPMLEKHLAAEQDFDTVCSAMDSQLGSAISAEQIVAIFEGFNQSADKLLTAWKEMVAAMKIISRDKAAYVNSRDYAATDWPKLWQGTHLFVHAITKYTGISAQSLDNVRHFLGDSRVLAACQEAAQAEAGLLSMNKDGEDLRQLAKEWRPVEEAHQSQ